MNKPRLRFAWLKWALIALFVVSATLFAVFYDFSTLKVFLAQYEFYGAVICVFVYALLGPTPIPSEPLTLLILAWQGPVAAVLAATLGNTLAAFMEFFIGVSLGDLADFEKRKQALPFGLGRLPIDSPVFLLFARMLPGYSSKIVSVAAGVYRVPIGTYLWTSMASNLFGASIVTLGGMGLIKLVR
jgi:uncharacterized membrane protein YdjX (TVP38/TMEM64 family)